MVLVIRRTRRPMVCASSPFLRANTYVGDAEYTPILILWGVSNMVLDGTIAGILCYYLHSVRCPLPPLQTLVDASNPTSPGMASKEQKT